MTVARRLTCLREGLLEVREMRLEKGKYGDGGGSRGGRRSVGEEGER